MAEPQRGMRPGLPFLLVMTFCGPGRGFAGDVTLAGSPAGLVAPHPPALPCLALRLPDLRKVLPTVLPYPAPVSQVLRKRCPQITAFTGQWGGDRAKSPSPHPPKASGMARWPPAPPGAQCSSVSCCALRSWGLDLRPPGPSWGQGSNLLQGDSAEPGAVVWLLPRGHKHCYGLKAKVMRFVLAASYGPEQAPASF